MTILDKVTLLGHHEWNKINLLKTISNKRRTIGDWKPLRFLEFVDTFVIW